jgi:hypothetical protein
VKDKTRVEVPWFFKEGSLEATCEDPRLGDLPPGWTRVSRDRVAEDPLTVAAFRNSYTGESRKSDPRVDLDVLQQRGVHVEMIALI